MNKVTFKSNSKIAFIENAVYLRGGNLCRSPNIEKERHFDVMAGIRFAHYRFFVSGVRRTGDFPHKGPVMQIFFMMLALTNYRTNSRVAAICATTALM